MNVIWGAVIGSQEFKAQYVSEKVKKWTEDVQELSRLAKDEPQAVYSCYTKAVCHKWAYVQRTIPETSQLFQSLEDAIREELIPSQVGRKVSSIERRLLALPVRLGGLGISNPTETADDEFRVPSHQTWSQSYRIKNKICPITTKQM